MRRPARAPNIVALLTSFAVLAAACTSPEPVEEGLPVPTTGTPTAPSTTTPPPRHYVSLGDSYSAGEGLPAPVQPCGRTPGAYPALVAERAGLVASFHACNGATTTDVLEAEQVPGAGRQIEAVTPEADVVTISIGGNDIGFRRVMTDCVLGNLPCTRLAGQVATNLAALAPRLTAVYRAIRRRAPDARLLVVGYPQLVVDPGAAPSAPSGSAAGCAGMTVEENQWVRQEGEALNALIRSAATATGAIFIDAAGPFTGHEACAPEPWMAGLHLSDVVASFHPNPAGQEQLARLVLDNLPDR